MNGLDLFSGVGGISLALSPWTRTIAYCENNRYAQGVLLSRMSSGELEIAPIWDDVRTIRGEMLPPIDIISGGFPCQDISIAGRGSGLAGQRSGLFSEIMRLAKEIKPTFLFLENVPAIRTRGLDHVAEWIASAGYDCRWDFVSAEEVGAPFKGQRWFCLATSHGLRRRQKQERIARQQDSSINRNDREKLGETTSTGLERREGPEKTWEALRCNRSTGPQQWPHWLPKPSLPRGDDGLSFRLERIRSSGNAVVPVQAREAFKRLMGLNKPQPERGGE